MQNTSTMHQPEQSITEEHMRNTATSVIPKFESGVIKAVQESYPLYPILRKVNQPFFLWILAGLKKSTVYLKPAKLFFKEP